MAVGQALDQNCPGAEFIKICAHNKQKHGDVGHYRGPLAEGHTKDP